MCCERLMLLPGVSGIRSVRWCRLLRPKDATVRLPRVRRRVRSWDGRLGPSPRESGRGCRAGRECRGGGHSEAPAYRPGASGPRSSGRREGCRRAGAPSASRTGRSRRSTGRCVRLRCRRAIARVPCTGGWSTRHLPSSEPIRLGDNATNAAGRVPAWVRPSAGRPHARTAHQHPSQARPHPAPYMRRSASADPTTAGPEGISPPGPAANRLRWNGRTQVSICHGTSTPCALMCTPGRARSSPGMPKTGPCWVIRWTTGSTRWQPCPPTRSVGCGNLRRETCSTLPPGTSVTT